jgi:hypothetical protein
VAGADVRTRPFSSAVPWRFVGAPEHVMYSDIYHAGNPVSRGVKRDRARRVTDLHPSI